MLLLPNMLSFVERFVSGLASILVTDHGLLAMLDDVAGSYQARKTARELGGQ